MSEEDRVLEERIPEEDWRRLADLLDQLEQRGLRRLSATDLDEIVHLYRTSASDLAERRAQAETAAGNDESRVPSKSAELERLERLVARAYLRLHGRRRPSWSAWSRFWRKSIPRAFRASTGPFTFAALLFASALVLGTISSLLDESFAGFLLGPEALDRLRGGELWTGDLFQLAPESALTARALTRNLTIAFLAFAGGLTLGLGTALVLAVNGFQVGLLLPLVSRYDLAVEFYDFIAAHGFLELTMIVLAGGAGFRLADAIITPGNWPRRFALRIAAADGARLLAFITIGFVVASALEGYVSPSPQLSFALKLLVGISVWIAALGYLVLGGRRRDERTKNDEYSPRRRIRTRQKPI